LKPCSYNESKMTTTIRAVYEGGTLRLKEPLHLKFGQEIWLTIDDFIDVENDPAFDISSLAIDTGIADLATEHDHYLYGVPKGVR